MPKNYYRIMLGRKSAFAADCLKNGYIGADFGIRTDLTKHRSEDWRDFNTQFIPEFMNTNPEKTKVAAGLACGALWTITKGIKAGDIILSPTGDGTYQVGEALDGYTYNPGQSLPHQRPVRWLNKTISRNEMSASLQNSSGSIGTVSTITKFGSEIEILIGNVSSPTIFSTDETVEDPSVFALEKHLEDFLVKNWSSTELGKRYDIYQDETGTGQQFQTDTGPIDILAISKDKKELVVVELKKGRASDSVVGQVQRYMGFIADEYAEEDQKVKGIIIALEDTLSIRRALSVAPNIEFYKYQISFKLFKI